MKIVVCSAGRPYILKKQTLHVLRTANITQTDIFIIVPYEEVPLYTNALADTNDLPFCIWGAPRGLTKQRQFARNLFLPEEEIVFMDDDIQRFRELQADGTLKDITTGEEIFRSCFQRMREEECILWGIYPIANRGWQSHKIQKDNCYCVGALYGLLNTAPPEPAEDEAEDFTRQLQIQSQGQHVLRFCQYGIQTKYWRSDKEDGGIRRTKESTVRIFNGLAEQYSSLVKLYTTRTGKLNLKFLCRPTVT